MELELRFHLPLLTKCLQPPRQSQQVPPRHLLERTHDQLRFAIVARIFPRACTDWEIELTSVMGEVILVQRTPALLCGWRVDVVVIAEED